MRISDWSSDVCSSDLAAVGGQDHVTVEHQPPHGCMPHLLGIAGGEADDIAVGLHQRARDAERQTITGLFHQVAHLTVDREQQFGLDPAVHRRQLGGSEGHTSELQSRMRISYAVFCLNTNKYSTYG